MEIDEFDSKVSAITARRPQLLALERDRKATEEMVDCVEAYYHQMRLPESYKAFVQRYGGGYFGAVLVFSCDAAGAFYLPDHAGKEWVTQHAFLPIIDLETGDYLGFPIREGSVEDTIAWYDHEENAWRETDRDFLELLLEQGMWTAL